MYVCHHCGSVSRLDGVNYCTNVNCKYYQKNVDNADFSASKRNLKVDYGTFNYEGDINYPSDKANRYYQNSDTQTQQNPNMNANYNNLSMDYANNFNAKSELKSDHKPDYKPKYQDYKPEYKSEYKSEYQDYKPEYKSEYKSEYTSDKTDYGEFKSNLSPNNMPMHEFMPNHNQNTYPCGTLAFATVPKQKYEKIYSPLEALKAGTIFPSLSMPYDKKIIRRG